MRHRSRYRYARQVQLSYHALHLTPRSLPQQRVLGSRITAQPAPASVDAGHDYFGNPLSFLTLTEPHDQLVVDMQSEVDVRFPEPPAETPPWEAVREAVAACADPELAAAAEFAYPSAMATPDAAIAAYAAACFPPGMPVLAGARELTRRIHADFAYDPGATSIATPLSAVMQARRGVCQDFAQVQIAGLRALGLAARYVSGYIRNDRSAGLELATSVAGLAGRGGHDAADAAPGRQAGSHPGAQARAAAERPGAARTGIGAAAEARMASLAGGPAEGGAAEGGAADQDSAADSPDGFVGADASHAWVSVFCPGAGWVQFDPTNDLVVRESHIVLAWGRDYRDVSPISGILMGGGEHTLDVEVSVRAIR